MWKLGCASSKTYRTLGTPKIVGGGVFRRSFLELHGWEHLLKMDLLTISPSRNLSFHPITLTFKHMFFVGAMLILLGL